MRQNIKELTLMHLEELAYQYIEECMNHQKEVPTASGKAVKVFERHIPTIDYFLRIWIPSKGKPTIHRATYYRWLNEENDKLKCDTIKNIEALFKALATDIVANEGKGIFYAKNRLGMTDRPTIETMQIEQPLFPELNVVKVEITRQGD